MIVTVPVPVPIAAPFGLDRTTVNVSVGSAFVSPVMVTENVSDVTPGLNVRVEVFDVKSLLARAVPATVETTTVTDVVDALDSVTVTFTVTLLLPSVTVASLTEIVRDVVVGDRARRAHRRPECVPGARGDPEHDRFGTLDRGVVDRANCDRRARRAGRQRQRRAVADSVHPLRSPCSPFRPAAPLQVRLTTTWFVRLAGARDREDDRVAALLGAGCVGRRDGDDRGDVVVDDRPARGGRRDDGVARAGRKGRGQRLGRLDGDIVDRRDVTVADVAPGARVSVRPLAASVPPVTVAV